MSLMYLSSDTEAEGFRLHMDNQKRRKKQNKNAFCSGLQSIKFLSKDL